MLKVEVYVAPSKLHGLGVFAKNFIPKDTLTWEFLENFDRVYSKEEFLRFPPMVQKHLLHHGYHMKLTPDHIYLDGDLAIFMNFSKTDYNIRDTDHFSYAARDIQAGEEMIFNAFLMSDLYQEDYTLKFG